MQAAARPKVVITGGHPGDPECGCAGTIARYTELGHEVVLLYLNRGEGFCGGGGAHQSGPRRGGPPPRRWAARPPPPDGEGRRVLKAPAPFAGQYDGRAI